VWIPNGEHMRSPESQGGHCRRWRRGWILSAQEDTHEGKRTVGVDGWSVCDGRAHPRYGRLRGRYEGEDLVVISIPMEERRGKEQEMKNIGMHFLAFDLPLARDEI